MLKGIKLDGTNLPLLKVTKVSEINFKHGDGRGRIYIEEIKPGEWRLTYTTHTIPDITHLTGLKFVREGDTRRQSRRYRLATEE